MNKIGNKAIITKILNSEFSDSVILHEVGTLGRYDGEEIGEPDIIYLDDDEVEFLKNIEVKIIETTTDMVEEYI